MTRILYLLWIAFVFYSCKNDNQERAPISYSTTEISNEISTAQQIANAHGFERWKDINEIKFRFNVHRNENTSGRSWLWKPKTEDVSFIADTDTIHYNRKAMDSIALQTDRKFINDKFWLLIPFQLVWDEGATISDPKKEMAPISKVELNTITLTYSNEGGYTPGDAYDLFYDDNFIIKEWIFRKGNANEPSMITTFENHQDYNGIKIALDHKKEEGDFNLFFSNVEIK